MSKENWGINITYNGELYAFTNADLWLYFNGKFEYKVPDEVAEELEREYADVEWIEGV